MLEVFRSARRATLWFAEITAVAALVMLSIGLMAGWAEARGAHGIAWAIVAATVTQTFLYFHGLYASEAIDAREELAAVLQALALSALALITIGIAAPSRPFTPTAAALAFAAAALVLPAMRAGSRAVSRTVNHPRGAVILGHGRLAQDCGALLQSSRDLGFEFAGMLVNDEERASSPGVIGMYSDLLRAVEKHDAGLVIVAFTDRRGAFPAEELLALKFRGIEIVEGVDFYERVTSKLYVEAMRPSQLIFARGFRVDRDARRVKRALDVVAAAIGLVLSLPLCLIAALAIKLESRGPVFYEQLRSGALGQNFTLRKFRSMRVDAEANGARFAEENDPRVTSVGRFLRRTRIDEIPQLWNVLAGEMSMVGPRPERPVFIEELERRIPFFRERLYVKPGITGHAQVRCRYGASTEDHLEKLQHDLYYIKTWSIWFDLSILLDTIKVVLLRIGSR